MNPMDVLAPNIMGTLAKNSGTDNLMANIGWGVPETMQANPAATMNKERSANPSITRLRRAKAREFGVSMDEVQ